MNNNNPNPMAELSRLFEAQSGEIETLRESMTDMMLRIENVGWEKLTGYDDDTGLSLDALRELDEKLSDLVATNPLLKRAMQLRHGYVFGKGVVFTEVKPQAQAVLDDPINKRALFSVQAYEELNLAKGTAGNVFVLYDTKAKRFTRVPIRQITGVKTSDDSNEVIEYLQRSWSSNGKQHTMWYPLNTTAKPATQIQIGVAGPTEDVDKNKIMYHETSNRQVGWTFGIPDCLAAMAWTLAYSAYLKNNATLVQAYSQLAMKITARTKKGADTAAARVAVPGVGGTAVVGDGNEITALPATGSQVNFNNGQPLAAMVASSLGISVIALLSSPGAAGGSYGAAATLDAPTLIGMEAIQDTWALFYSTILRDLKSRDAQAEFPSIETDPVYRQIGAAAQALSVGGMTQQEFYEFVHDRLDIGKPSEGELPGPGWYNAGAAVLAAEISAQAAKDEADAAAANPIASQGNSGVTGSNTQGDTNNDE